MKFKKLAQILSLSAATMMATPACTTYMSDVRYETRAVETQKEDMRAHYLKHVPSQEKLDKMTSLEKVVEAFNQYLMDAKKNEMGSTTVFTNGCAKATIDVHGEEIELIFPLYRPQEDGNWLYIIEDKIIDKDKILKDLEKVLEDAVDLDYNLYSKTQEQTNSIIKRIFKGSEKDAAKDIPKTDLIFDNVFNFLELNKKDFLPEGGKVFFAPLPEGTFAVTYLENNKIIYSPTARRQDYVWGKPHTMAHELIHNNTKMQGVPSALAKDLEIQAFQMNLLNQHNFINFLFHGYAKPFWRLAETYYGMDLDKMRKSLIKEVLYNYVEIDEEALAKIMPEINNLSKELRDIYVNKAIPEYLALTPYWLMLNTHLRNPTSPMDIMVTKELKPAMANYEEWLEMNRHKIDQVIQDVNNSYSMPALRRFGPFVSYSGRPYRDQVMGQCAFSGFTEKEAEIVYHLALKRTFLDEKGNVNYGGITLEQSFLAMQELVNSFDMVVNKYEDWKKNPKLQNKLATYNWLLNRISVAKRFAKFANEYGNKTSEQFSTNVFDPRINLEQEYKHKPDFLKYATPINARFVENIDLNGDGKIEFKLLAYDLVKSIGFDKDGIDYLEYYRDGEDKPFLIAYPSKYSKIPDMVLIDKDKKGSKDFGVFDANKKVKNLEEIEELLKEKSLLDLLTLNLFNQGKIILSKLF